MAWTEPEMTVEEMRKEVQETRKVHVTEEEIYEAWDDLKKKLFGSEDNYESEKVYDWEKPFLEKNEHADRSDSAAL